MRARADTCQFWALTPAVKQINAQDIEETMILLVFARASFKLQSVQLSAVRSRRTAVKEGLNHGPA